MKEGYKLCPYCSKEIKEGEVKCQYCKKDLDKKVNNNTGNNDLSEKDKALRKAENYIYEAGGVGCIITLITIIMYIKSVINGENFLGGNNIGSFLDIIYYVVLLFFLYKKNRMAALFLLLNYIIGSIAFIIEGYKFKSIRLFVIYFLFLGVIGCFKYHKLNNQKKLSQSEIIILVIGIIYTIMGLLGLGVLSLSE